MLFDSGAVRAAVLAETNDYRASKNIPQLKENAALEAATTASAVYLWTCPVFVERFGVGSV